MKLSKEMLIDEVAFLFDNVKSLNEKETKDYLITMLAFHMAYIKQTKQSEKLHEFVKDYK